MDRSRRNATLASTDRLAWLLDSSIPLPFGRSVGLDGLIGLIPGLGDVAGSALSGFIVFRAWRMGVSRAVLLRMLGNVGLEMLVGTVPVVGDLFDFAFKANQRNVALLRANLTDAPTTARRSRAVVALWVACLVLAAVAIATIGVLLARSIWNFLVGT